MRAEKSEVDRLVCKNEKLLACTSWKPKHSLEQGLIKTIDWIKKVDSDKLKNMSQYNV